MWSDFRNYKDDHLCSFAFNIGAGNAFLVELTWTMLAIEIAASKNWSYDIWLESDFKLVTKAFTNPVMPWKIMIYWLNVLHITKFIHFIVTHIFREENHCADMLVFIGLSIPKFFG
jgi:hypothetical protein